MRGAAANLRRYALVVTPAGEAVAARIKRTGPPNPLAVGHGRSTGEAAQLAGLLFPVCPRAHAAAALRAIEHIAGIELPEGQAAARDAVVLAESLAGCVWRAALTWPDLLGAPPDPTPVREARAAAEVVVQALYPGRWAQAGGAEIRVDEAALAAAVETFLRCVSKDAVSQSAIQQAAPTVEISAPISALGADIQSAVLAPDNAAREESPRSLQAEGAPPRRLADWFDAQRAYAEALAGQLEAAARRVCNAPPVSLPPAISGAGIGVATTARGRLRHAMTISDGVITHWTGAAPTDWNFAPAGPAVRIAESLRAGDDLEREARWLVAAFDPCAPCEVQLEREAAHA